MANRFFTNKNVSLLQIVFSQPVITLVAITSSLKSTISLRPLSDIASLGTTSHEVHHWVLPYLTLDAASPEVHHWTLPHLKYITIP